MGKVSKQQTKYQQKTKYKSNCHQESKSKNIPNWRQIEDWRYTRRNGRNTRLAGADADRSNEKTNTRGKTKTIHTDTNDKTGNRWGERGQRRPGEVTRGEAQRRKHWQTEGDKLQQGEYTGDTERTREHKRAWKSKNTTQDTEPRYQNITQNEPWQSMLSVSVVLMLWLLGVYVITNWIIQVCLTSRVSLKRKKNTYFYLVLLLAQLNWFGAASSKALMHLKCCLLLQDYF